ncbi:MAG: TerB family tellurite resistance protein [Bacteroidota bacterium]|nr:TerB family tellurite resistance protein [Bacteroidota bacterium]
MAFISRLLGFGLGWALGGPIGGILGLIFGSMVDSATTGIYTGSGDQFNGNNITHPGDFSVSLLILSAAVMKADGKLLRSELDYVKNFFVNQFGIEVAEDRIKVLREILKQDIDYLPVCEQIRQYMDYPSRLQLMHYLFGLAMADNQLDETELSLLNRMAGILGLPGQEFESIKAMFVKDNDAAYRILEISPDVSDEEVKKAYRAMAMKHHPDRVAHLGEEVQYAAKEKFQKINQAYNDIKKTRGFN